MADLLGRPVLRARDRAALQRKLGRRQSLAVVAPSNAGKSNLLQTLDLASADSLRLQSDEAVSPTNSHGRAARRIHVLIDCGGVEGARFRELVVSAMIDELRSEDPDYAVPTDLIRDLEQTLNHIRREPQRSDEASDAGLRVLFASAVRNVTRDGNFHFVLLLDHFDRAFAAYDAGLLDQLRAFAEGIRNPVTYVTNTRRPLGAIRGDSNTSDFRGLFETYYLGPLSDDEARDVIDYRAPPWVGDSAIVARALELCAGHLGLLGRVSAVDAPHLLIDPISAAASVLVHGWREVTHECEALWDALDGREQGCLIGIAHGFDRSYPTAEAELERMGVTDRPSDGRTWIRSPLFAAFVKTRLPIVLTDDGEIEELGGRAADEFTEQEMRIIRSLVKQYPRILPRGELIEAAWEAKAGVSDAAIEKAMSRLRRKVQAVDVEQVRGGYRLVIRGAVRLVLAADVGVARN